YVEVGPDGVLAGLIPDCLTGLGEFGDSGESGDEPDAPALVVVPTLRRNRPERDALLGALAEIFVDGGRPRWTEVIGQGATGRRVRAATGDGSRARRRGRGLDAACRGCARGGGSGRGSGAGGVAAGRRGRG